MAMAVLGITLITACSQTPTVPANKPPVAQAGADQTLTLGDKAFLNGSASTDPDGDPITHQWTLTGFPAGSQASLTTPTKVTTEFTPDKEGSYTARLIVRDGKTASTPDEVTILVVKPGTPIARAGADQTRTVGETVNLDGSASSDPANLALTYQWAITTKPQNSLVTLQNPQAAKASFVPDLPGDYTLTLTVTNGKITSQSDSVTIQVTPAVTNNPTANAGPDTELMAGESLTLDGSKSSDPKGLKLTYQWAWEQKPTGSNAALTNPTTAKPTLKTDLPGVYILALTVSNGTLSSSKDLVFITATPNQPPTANAGDDTYTAQNQPVDLSCNFSSDPEGKPLTCNWTLGTSPDGSQPTLTPKGNTLTFNSNLEGLYRIDLTVNDGANTSMTDSVIVEVGRPTKTLTHQPIDAEYSRALDKIITVSDSPAQLHIYDPVTGTDTTINVPLAPTSVSVGPDGLYAAVGHNAHVSYVDLKNAKLLKTLDVSTDVLDVILAGNGYVYAMPKRDQWESIYGIEIATNTEVQSTGYSIYAGTKAKLHPSGSFMYGANNGLSPSDIEKYDIRKGTPNVMYDSPYHGDYSMCGDLWFSEDGARIFTKCGNVFRATESQQTDMTYNGSLKVGIGSLDHNQSAGVIAVLPANEWSQSGDDTKLKLFNYDFLSTRSEQRLPKMKTPGGIYALHGKYVFFNKAGTEIYTLMQVDGSAGALHDFAVATFNP